MSRCITARSQTLKKSLRTANRPRPDATHKMHIGNLDDKLNFKLA